ncbi:Helicase, C-terminal [Fusarium oxysporum f. sp. vasinfectum]|nr:Helicase, C-terminal [Fusarium oxysporum f. sp. vasinfectum]
MPLWRACKLQTYFTAKGLIDYFLVEEDPSLPLTGGALAGSGLAMASTSQEEGKLFEDLKADIIQASRDLDKEAEIVQDVEASRADRVPWLVHTGFPTHLQGLRDTEIMSSDKSPDRKMTQQRAKRLSNFRSDDSHMSSAKASKFRSFKNESSLTSYFRITKQLLAYYYRVVYGEDGHFTRGDESHVVPQDIIETTPLQRQAIEDIIGALRRRDKAAKGRGTPSCDKKDGIATRDYDERDAELKHTIRKFYISLICQTVGSRPFRSAILSFCAMLSRTKALTRRVDNEQHKRCTWREPGNFNSNLSALTWTAQLILFDFVCFQKQDDEDGIPDLLDQMCKKYFQQMAETPFGHVLQWRLYLFAASRTSLTKHQARWSLDGETVDYMGTKLHMEQVTQLVESEFRQAHSLLYDKLLFGMRDVAPIEAWRLHDDLDVDDYGASWLTDERNREILAGTHDALLRQIEERADLRQVFVRLDPNGGVRLCPKAIAIYEAHVQEFLKRMLAPISVPSGPPLRSPGTTLHHMVMIYVRYSKSQEQTGEEKDNIRFLPPAVGNLLLTYLAFVLPLRQAFLRQSKPGALLSPYLWSKLGGEVWRDGMVSSCLRRACVRAEVPQFQVAWWRQVAASITKEKFSAREQANFDMGEIAASEEVEDEADLAYLAGMSNHSFRTFNYSYAGSTTLTVTSSLHRAYRASQSWRSLFRIDQVLQGKRPPAVSDTQAQGLLNACKKVRFRARPAAKEDGIIAAARRLHNDPELQLRRPGQRDAMLATMGPRAPEQVIVVLATGSGKTLVFMVGATLAGAETTILILPTVALRGSKKSAPIVVVSAEAACTEAFLEYANRLSDRQCLDRIVIDECHLTITASCYRRSMSQLAWHVRQIRTQTVWLTATLPPIYQELFFEHNKLVRPHIVRESTNRPNIRYIVQQERGLGNLCEQAACLVQSCWTRTDLFKSERDRVIIYCPTKDLVAELADMLGCPSYTAESGTEEEKMAIIERWLTAADSPIIVATSALGPGFDYPHIRLVIHVDAPSLLTDFSQESGRAGRDGEVAESIVLLSAAWQPQLGRPVAADKEAMQLYLLQEYCSRGVLSQFLDSKPDWRWCMEGDELCSVCPEHHAQCRPPTLEFYLPRPLRDETEAGQDGDNGSADLTVSEMIFTGPAEVLRQDQVRDEELSRYERDLETMKGCCLYCRVEGKSFEHTVTACARRFDWIRAKQKALRDCQSKKKEWMDRHAVCWKCYQPQEICRAADPEYEGDNSCQYPDMVMPLCFGAFSRPGRTKWFLKHFNESFKTCQEYMLWLGKGASLGGSRCVNANCVAALLLGEFE